MAGVAQLVRAPVCGIGGRRFETGRPPHFFQLFHDLFFSFYIAFGRFNIGVSKNLIAQHKNELALQAI